MKLAASALILALLTSKAAAQGGWATEKHPDLGLTFPRANSYEQVPTQPDEVFVLLYFVEKVVEGAKKKGPRPELNVVWIEHDAAGEEEKAAPKEEGPTEKPIDSLESFLASRLKEWDLGPAKAGKERDGYAGKECVLRPNFKNRWRDGSGWVYAYSNRERTIAFLGLCDQEDSKDQIRIWRHTAERVQFDEPEEQDVAKLERMYERLALSDPGFRIDVRKKLVRGWKAVDTEHYIVIYDTKDQPLVRKIVRDLELLHSEYAKFFEPVKKIEAVSTVRVCKNRAEYLSYGGSANSNGYWNSSVGELVLYDAEVVEDHVRSDARTFGTLYHEAFHQYIHYSSGELAPHSWFNEGHGDYFGGAVVKDGKVWSIGLNPKRVDLARWMVAAGEFVPWQEILRYEQPQYYAEAKVGICYAQGWSMIYFLRKSKAVQKRAEWAGILPKYFEALKESYSKGLAALDASGQKGDAKAREKAALEARQQAVEAAFEGINVAEIERAWVEFMRALEIPKRG